MNQRDNMQRLEGAFADLASEYLRVSNQLSDSQLDKLQEASRAISPKVAALSAQVEEVIGPAVARLLEFREKSFSDFEAAASELGNLGPYALISLLKSQDETARLMASWAIARREEKIHCAYVAINSLLEDHNPAVRRQAVIAAVKFWGDDEALVQKVIEKLSDPEVRLAAIWSLGSGGRSVLPTVLPSLKEMLNEPEWETRLEAAVALGCIGAEPKLIVPILALAVEANLHHADMLRAAKTLESLGKEAEEALPALRRVAESSEDYRGQAARAAIRKIEEAVAKGN